MDRESTIRIGVVIGTGLVLAAGAQNAQYGGPVDPYANLPGTVALIGTVRDFREQQVPGGHDDFERKPTAGFGHYVGMVADQLDSDGKPAFASTGYLVKSQWKTAAGVAICPSKDYMPSADGDQAGAISSSEGGASTTPENFRKWFRDIPGVNVTGAYPLRLQRQPDTNTYVLDDRLDPHLKSLEGFFIVNDKLMGNSQGGNKNFHFTFELQTEFKYEKGTGQQFTFIGDDDVWVFIDGKLVIDIGGVHSAVEQSVFLDRLTWLEDGKTYPLNFFFAERHRTQSNFRIETSLALRDISVPTVSALYD